MKNIESVKNNTVDVAELVKALEIKSGVRAGYVIKPVGCIGCGLSGAPGDPVGVKQV